MLIDFLRPILENPFFVKYGLLGLFLNAVFAAIVPFPIVVTSTALLLEGQSEISVFTVMSIGSVIGGIVTYFIGYDGGKIYKILRKTHSEDHHKKSFEWLNKYGWSIIFALSLCPHTDRGRNNNRRSKKIQFQKICHSHEYCKSS